MSTDPGRLSRMVYADLDIDVPGLEAELEAVPRKVYALRQKIAPLRAELRMLQARFESKGRSPSHFDIQRGLLLSELKEEARVLYDRDPKFKEAAKGRQVKIELTDGRAEDIAHAHPRYHRFVEEAEDQQKRIADLGREISDLYDRVEVWKGRKEYLTQKLEQARALTYAWSAEARLTPH